MPVSFRPAAAALATLFALTAAAPPAAAQEEWWQSKSDGAFMARLRGIVVAPNESLEVNGVPGQDAEISTAVVPELDLTYFFTDTIAAELILAVTPHDVTGEGSVIGGTDLGDVLLLPPTLTLQYHFSDLGPWKPYLGAGVNYTFFLNEDGGQFNDIDYDDTFGFALQAGLDYEIAEGVYLNADVKYIFLETDWTLDARNAGLGVQTGSVDINPLIVGVGIGYRF